LSLCQLTRLGNPKDKKVPFVEEKYQDVPDSPKIGAPPARYVQDRILKRIEKVGHCEVGHVTGLVRSDKDLVSMVQCIDAVWMHLCAPIPPPWGPKDQQEGGMDAHAPQGAENDPPQALPVENIFQDFTFFCQLELAQS
jgi:hypothetical protein